MTIIFRHMRTNFDTRQSFQMFHNIELLTRFLETKIIKNENI